MRVDNYFGIGVPTGAEVGKAQGLQRFLFPGTYYKIRKSMHTFFLKILSFFLIIREKIGLYLDLRSSISSTFKHL